MEDEGAKDLSISDKTSKINFSIEVENSQRSIMSQKRKSLNVQFSPRKKLNNRKPSYPDRTWSSSAAQHHSIPSDTDSPTRNKTPQETVILINPCATKILPSHTALEDSTSRSIMPETAVYPSVLQNAGSSFVIPETFNLAANTGYMVPATSAYMPLSTLDNDELDGDQYHEIMQGLLQAIHNQNRIMEECRNILTSIHRAIVPFQPLPIMVPPTSPQLPLNLSSQPSTTTNVSNWDNNHAPGPVVATVPPILANVSPTPDTTMVAANPTIPPIPPTPTLANIVPPPVAIIAAAAAHNNPITSTSSMTFEQPQPASKTTQTSLSKEPEKPTVFGPDGEFSSAYLRFVHGKSSTATSFANVLMKEVFTLEERISSNCNGVMGKKALEAVRLDKIKRAVRRFYTDTEEEFQDMWKKCRKSIDSTNRNLKFVIMKKPNM